MRGNDLVLVQGIRDTRDTLAGWRGERWRVVGSWTLLSALVSVGLLASVYAVAQLTAPDSTPLYLVGIDGPPTLAEAGQVLFRNSLVLALHAFACVAGFIAGSSLPQSAQSYSGLWRTVHDRAGPLAIAFVVGATTFSLMTQAYLLGGTASTVAAQLGLSPGVLVLALLPHALPELIALFLPLAAWLMASRTGDWHKLLAATFVTVAIAAPVLIVTAGVETYLTPRLLAALAG